jgi:UTP-glucose-1-phosphate uridylyltransferase
MPAYSAYSTIYYGKIAYNTTYYCPCSPPVEKPPKFKQGDRITTNLIGSYITKDCIYEVLEHKKTLLDGEMVRIITDSFEKAWMNADYFKKLGD